MSPGQAQRKPVDARSDIFSPGVVLCELITGRRPFRTDSAIETALGPEPLPEWEHLRCWLEGEIALAPAGIAAVRGDLRGALRHYHTSGAGCGAATPASSVDCEISVKNPGVGALGCTVLVVEEWDPSLLARQPRRTRRQ